MNINTGIIALFVGVGVGLYIVISTILKSRNDKPQSIGNITEQNQEIKSIKNTKIENNNISFGQSVKLGIGIGIGFTIWAIVLGILFTIFFGSITGLFFGPILNRAF